MLEEGLCNSTYCQVFLKINLTYTFCCALTPLLPMIFWCYTVSPPTSGHGPVEFRNEKSGYQTFSTEICLLFVLNPISFQQTDIPFSDMPLINMDFVSTLKGGCHEFRIFLQYQSLLSRTVQTVVYVGPQFG